MTLAEFDQAFSRLDKKTREMLDEIPDELLYARPGANTLSRGENLLRSAAVVEQMAGGITTRLWDDPFEWTFPEKLHTKQLILEYLDEVEAARLRAFTFLRSEKDLQRLTPAPVELKSINQILFDTLERAEEFLSQMTSAS